MSILKFTNTFLMLYLFGMLFSDYPIEGATINKRICWEYACYTGDCIAFEKSCDANINLRPAVGMCVLPPYPDHGRYNASMGLKPGDAAPNVSLTYSCDLGHRLKGKSSPECVKGTWLVELPTCTNQCNPLKSTSVDFKCYKQNSTLQISCTLPQANNSLAKAKCKDSYYSESPLKDLMCINGSWDHMPYCIPECGTVAPEGETLVINGEKAKINEFPWHVGLYDKTSTPIIQICGGNIFTPKLVLTAAHCIYKDQAGKYPAASFAVAAGKLYRRWNSRRDDEKYVQKINVMRIEIPDRYKGASNAFMADLAVLVLERSFVFNSFVRPACIQFDTKQRLDGQSGRVAGWGLTAEDGSSSNILRTVTLPHVSFQECYNNSKKSFQPLITDDKICAGYKNGTALCKGDSGGGLVFSGHYTDRNLYYLHGIVSNSPRNEALTSCSAFAYTGFTNIFKHREWLEDVCLLEWGCENGGCISLEQRCHGGIDYCLDNDETGFCSGTNASTTRDLCVLPAYPPHGNYRATRGRQPGDAVFQTSLKYTCDLGYRLQGEGSPNCVRGIWGAEVPTCEKFDQDQNTQCGRVSPPSGESGFEKDITVNLTDVKYVAIPWTISLFSRYVSKPCELTEPDCWVHFADGSLISPKFVLTNAWTISYYNEIEVKARAGGLDAFFGPYQERIVAKTILHPDFTRENFQSRKYDVALLLVDSPFLSADNIGFICLPPPNLNMTSASCKVARKNSMRSVRDQQELFEMVDANLVDHDQCETTFRKNERNFRDFELYDSLTCASILKKSHRCAGVSGSLLMCRGEDHYYARGVLSFKHSCTVYKVPDLYTNVPKLRNWIDQEMMANGYKTSSVTVQETPRLD